MQIDMDHWSPRFIAVIIDSIIIAIPTFIIYYIPLNGYVPSWGSYVLLPLILGILEVIYFVFMEVSLATTIGKKALGLQVQTTNGSKVTFDKAFIRNISKIYWPLLLIDWVLAVATPGLDQRQKYTDRIAGTTVVST